MMNAYYKMIFWNEGRGYLLVFQLIKFAQFYQQWLFLPCWSLWRKGGVPVQHLFANKMLSDAEF